MKRIGITLLFISICPNVFGQFGGENYDTKKSILEVFELFFENEIKHQGVKGDWIFRLEEVTGLYKFDFNKDNLNDILMEFSAVPEEGGGVTLKFAVLFLNEGNNQFKYLNYLETQEIRFEKFENQQFTFSTNKSETEKVIFKFLDSKFVSTLKLPN